MLLALILAFAGTGWSQTPSMPNWSIATKYPGQQIYAGTGPSLATLNGRLFLAYKNNNSPQNIVLWYTTSTTASFTQVTSVSLPTGTAGSPTLGLYNGQLYIVYWASGNVLMQVHSTDGIGNNFSSPVTIGIPDSPGTNTGFTPSLKGSGSIAYLAYIANGTSSAGGTTPEPLVATSTDGINFSNSVYLRNNDSIGAKSAPNMALRQDPTGGSELMITWTMGSQNNPVVCTTFVNAGFPGGCGNQVISTGQLGGMPAISVSGNNNVYVVGRSNFSDHKMWQMGSYDGTLIWSGLTQSGSSFNDSPAMAVLGGRLFCVFRSNSDNNMWLQFADN
jgi:hypothetical protein